MRLTAAWRLIVATTPLISGCASVSRPPGGPDDKDPPRIIASSIDTNATSVSVKKLDIRFDEVISERPSATLGSGTGPVSLEAVVLLSPRTGSTKVDWHRDRITIEPRGGFRANTTYRITLLPGITDTRGNVRQEASSIVFSTGPSALPFSILGRVFDWPTSTPAPSAVVEAVANPDTKDSLVYVSVADSTGQFELGPLGPGKYLVRTYIDADRNRERGVLERWDSVTVNVTDHRPVVELRAIQRDTAIIGIERVEVMDSTWVRVVLDKPYDPRTPLQPTLVMLQRADSTQVSVIAVMTDGQATSLRPRTDSSARPVAPVAVAPVADSNSARIPAPKPSLPPPEKVIVLRLDPANSLKPGQSYRVTVRALRNLVGNAGSSGFGFVAPKPPTKPPA